MNQINNSTGLYTPDCIRTYTGKYVNVFNPDPSTICIEDIAHALANLCRFGGHTKEFYSVAQHCVLMSRMQPLDIKLTGAKWELYKKIDNQERLEFLLHDAAEFALVDVPKPIKAKLTNYKEIEDGLMRVIATKYGLRYPFVDSVHVLDDGMLQIEWDVLMLGDTKAIPNFICWSPAMAKQQFLQRFKELTQAPKYKPEPTSKQEDAKRSPFGPEIHDLFGK